MKKELSQEKLQDEIIKRVEEISGQNLFKCYQCGKCSAGCPVVSDMDILPNQIIRLLQIGESNHALNSKTIFLCATCFICESRCPKGVDVSSVMDALRFIKQSSGLDYISPQAIPDKVLSSLPQQAIVSFSRKFTG